MGSGDTTHSGQSRVNLLPRSTPSVTSNSMHVLAFATSAGIETNSDTSAQ